MPARAYRTRLAEDQALAASVARKLTHMGAGEVPVFEEVPGLKYFHAVPVRLLREFPDPKNAADQGTVARAGDQGEVQLVPNGHFYLSAPDPESSEMVMLCLDAYDGVDFDFISERL